MLPRSLLPPALTPHTYLAFQPLAASNSNHKAVQSLSSLTFLTLLWLGSTALEQADVIFLSRRASRRDSGLIAKWSSTSSASRALLETDRRCNTTGQQTEEKADGLCSTFCREDVELVLGLLLMTAWIGGCLLRSRGGATRVTDGRVACRWNELNRLMVLTVYWKEAVCVLSTHGPHFVWNLGESSSLRQEPSGTCFPDLSPERGMPPDSESLSQDTVRPDPCDAFGTRGASGRIPAVKRHKESVTGPRGPGGFGGGGRSLGGLRYHGT